MGPPPVADSNFCPVSRIFLLHQKFFISNSIFGKIYIFSIENNFRFQKKFLNAMKNFLEAKIQLFVKKIFKFFFKKSPKIALKIFSMCFLAKMRKKIWPALPR